MNRSDTKTGKKCVPLTLEKGPFSACRLRWFRERLCLIIDDGKLNDVDRLGNIPVLKSDDKVQHLVVKRVIHEDEEFSATPAISDGKFFIRSNKYSF